MSVFHPGPPRPLGILRRWGVDALLVLIAILVLPSKLQLDGRQPYDAVIYATVASSLAAGEGPWEPLGNERLPPQQVPGLSFLLAPFFVLLGAGLGSGLWCILTVAAILVVALRRLGDRLGGPPAGLLAVLLLLLAPAFRRSASSIMSEVPAALAGLAALAGTQAVNRRTAGAAATGLAAAAAAWLRYQGVLLVPACVGALALRPGRRPAFAAFAAGFAVLSAPLLLLNLHLYGGPFETGYAYYGGNLGLFRMGHAFGSGSDGPGNLVRYLADLVGASPHLFPVPVAALAVFGLATLAGRGHRGVAAFTLIWTAALVVSQSFYWWYEERYLVPTVPVLALAAGAGGNALLRRTGWRRAAALALLGLAVAQRWRELPDLFRVSWPRPHESTFLEAATCRMEDDAVLVSSLPPFLAQVYFPLRGTCRELIPIVDLDLRIHPGKPDERRILLPGADAGEGGWFLSRDVAGEAFIRLARSFHLEPVVVAGDAYLFRLRAP